MGASCAYDTENYRNGDTQKNGIAASLMDYARFNYIAQPGDKNVFYPPNGTLRSLCYELGIQSDSKCDSRGRGAYTRPVDYGKTEI
jgi:hypothetical protein